MNETEYAYAVARIRANETKLLTRGDLESLASAPDYETALSFLADKGWEVPSEGEKFDVAERETAKAWELIADSVPDASLFEALIIGNDFFNVKATIKCVFSNKDPAEYVVSPCTVDPEKIKTAVVNGDFGGLPERLAERAEAAYDAASRLEDGRLAETILDRASLETRLELAKKSGCEPLERVARLNAVAANVKIALRCRATGQSEEFALGAMCDCGLDRAELLKAASSLGSAAEYLDSNGWGFLSESLKKGFPEFEKKLDDSVIETVESAKYEALGPDPAAAYYYAKAAEAKNVRLILAAKQNGVPVEKIRERARKLYV